MVQTLTIPHPAAAPVHRAAYVVSGGPTYHHPAMVHPSVPSIAAATYGHIPHPTLVPSRHTALPFTNLDTGVDMMNEEEFYRAQNKLHQR